MDEIRATGTANVIREGSEIVEKWNSQKISHEMQKAELIIIDTREKGIEKIRNIGIRAG